MADDLDRLPRIPRKAILLRASAELFAARGFRSVSIDEIGHAAGISGPAVYRHFATKTDILLRLCDSAMDHLLAGGQQILDGHPSGAARVTALVDLHVEFAVRERASLAVYVREQMELAPRDLRTLRGRQREYERLWVDAIREVADIPVAEARAVAKLLLSMLNGTAHVREAIPRAELVDTLSQMAVGALREVGVPLAVGPGGSASRPVERPEPSPGEGA